MDLFNLAPERKLYEILKHSTLEEREILCKNNKFKAMCKMIDFDTNTKLTGPLRGQGSSTFKVILESFPDFSSGLQFIEAVRPGFIYTEEFKAYVNDLLEINENENYTSFILGDLEYRRYMRNNKIYKEEWLKNGKLHRTYGPAKIQYYENDIEWKFWYINGKLHRTDGPAMIEYYINKNIRFETWYINDELHRMGGPADIEYYENGHVKSKYWMINNEFHRKDGPAYIWYYENGQVEREYWYKNGKLHRTDGPVMIEYYENGQVKSKS